MKKISLILACLLSLNFLNAASHEIMEELTEKHNDIHKELKVQEEKIIDLNKLLLKEVLYQKELVFNKKITNQEEKYNKE